MRNQKYTLLVLVLILVGALVQNTIASGSQGSGSYQVYLPVIEHTVANNQILLGVYPENWWTPMPQDTLRNEIASLEAWTGKKHSLMGIFHFFNQPNVVSFMLVPIWEAGYLPFVNIYVNASAYDMASGKWDESIRSWARDFKVYANDGKRYAFLAPLQEMNWRGSPYSRDPQNFKLAYYRIQKIFQEEGVPRESIRWVFAPNGASDKNDPPFEDYYPGDQYVDVLAFSSYNFGRVKWTTPEAVFVPYIQRMTSLSPNKPIIIAQTGTTGGGPKDQWLADAYNLLKDYPQVKGIIYYNAIADYDWAIYQPPRGIVFEGYRQGVSNPVYEYIEPANIALLFPVTEP